MNNHWTHGEDPQIFKNVLINPIIKLGKNPSEAKSYRFISHITCLGKKL